MTLVAKAKKFMAGVAKSAAVDMLRGYIAKRINSIQADDLIKAIETDDTELFGKLTDKERRIFMTVSRRFSKYLDLLTVKNVMYWMIEDVPFHAGIIYGHPKGLKWLERVLENIRSRALEYTAAELELVPVST